MPLVEERVTISLKNILLATDFSSTADKATAYARNIARRFASRIEVAHIFDPSVVTSYEEAIIGLPVTDRRLAALEKLKLIETGLRAADIKAATTLSEGHHPAKALLKIAQYQDV